ncbi:hypothetical protein EB844_13715 [Paracoccus pantotrophus]|nr:hypothetical protein EB844_13715 [Paracoccus pantotrophus]
MASSTSPASGSGSAICQHDLGQARGEFGGGIGESQFAGLLNETYSEAIARRIDLGFQRRNGVAG